MEFLALLVVVFVIGSIFNLISVTSSHRKCILNLKERVEGLEEEQQKLLTYCCNLSDEIYELRNPIDPEDTDPEPPTLLS